jgi:ketosteroid isomerase-like protein
MQADTSTEAAVRKVLDQFIASYERGDVDGVVDTLVTGPDLVLLGTEADERRVGPAEVRAQFERDISQSSTRSLHLGWTSVSALGDVAWIAADLAIEMTADGRSTSFPVRLTAVLERRDGTWKIAQGHLSVADSSAPEGQSFPQ